MTKYKTIREPKKVVDSIICNVCGEEIFNGEDYVHIDKLWGYFSNKDNEHHSFDICESCYNKLVKTFKIKPTIE